MSASLSACGPWRSGRACLALLAVASLAACDGPQSAFRTGGADAAQLERLFLVMLAGAVVLWLAVNGLFLYVTRFHEQAMSRRLAEAVIVGGGIVLPFVVLVALVSFGLAIMPEQRAEGDGLRLRVTGEQWWWRVEYWPEGADAPVVSANEVRLPVGRRTEVELMASDVIHSFWIPGLGGKTDLIPGRLNRMSLEPTQAGTFRGQCAEFCGLSHALMAFQAVTMDDAAFEGWLAHEAQGIDAVADAAAAGTPAAVPAGQALFLAQGCGACHTVRGTAAQGAVGPDLTHLGGRLSLAAGILPLTVENLMTWIADPDAVKPGAEMPAYDHLSPDELRTLATWLEGLR